MNDQEIKYQHTYDQQKQSVSFLLEEYKHLAESFLRNEELGERRFNFFIALTTAVIGALVAIPKVYDGEVDPIFFFFVLVAVFLFGVVTLVRIIRRNMVTDEYLRRLGRIRRYFADRDPKIQLYLPYPPFDDQPQRKKEWKGWKKWYMIFSLGKGGLAEMVALVNSLIVAALCVLLAISPSRVIIGLSGLVGFTAAWIVQFIYIKHRYDKGMPTKDEIKFREIEATLIIWSETPQVIAGQIARLTSIENYRLLPQDSKTINDIYFDTPDHALQTQKLALRVREIDGTRWITLKGPSRPVDRWGGVERLEIEAPWSQDALTRVVKELMDKGIEVPQQRQKFDCVYPLDAMSSLGLEVVQRRKCQRKVRNIVHAGEESGPVLAELAIDSVVYHFSDHQVRHYEVEIEAKWDDGSTVIKIVIERLAKMCRRALRRWDYGKLATGKAIEKLLSEEALEGLLDNKNNLKPIAYDKVEDYLRYDNI